MSGSRPEAVEVEKERPSLIGTTKSDSRSSELRSISESRFQYMLQDLTTKEILSSYEEASPGILVLVLGAAFESSSSVESGMKRLYSAYTMHAHVETPVVLELWLRGEKIGEYGAKGLAFDPAAAADAPVRGYQPDTSPEQNDIPDGTNWVTDRRSGTYYAIACSVARQIPDQDRLYYVNEGVPRAAGFVHGKEC